MGLDIYKYKVVKPHSDDSFAETLDEINKVNTKYHTTMVNFIKPEFISIKKESFINYNNSYYNLIHLNAYNHASKEDLKKIHEILVTKVVHGFISNYPIGDVRVTEISGVCSEEDLKIMTNNLVQTNIFNITYRNGVFNITFPVDNLVYEPVDCYCFYKEEVNYQRKGEIGNLFYPLMDKLEDKYGGPICFKDDLEEIKKTFEKDTSIQEWTLKDDEYIYFWY